MWWHQNCICTWISSSVQKKSFKCLIYMNETLTPNYIFKMPRAKKLRKADGKFNSVAYAPVTKKTFYMVKKFWNKLSVYISNNLCTPIYFSAKFYVVCTGHTNKSIFCETDLCTYSTWRWTCKFFFQFLWHFSIYDILKCIKLQPQTLLSRACMANTKLRWSQ
jgi:hypothetical protein